MPKKAKKFVLSAYLKNAVRRLSYKIRARAEAYANVRMPKPANWPNSRVKWVVPCAGCAKLFAMGDTQCDHIEPIIPVTGWPLAPDSKLYDLEPKAKDMNVLVYRTFVPANKLQILCKPCHKTKSLLENARRREC